MQVQDLYLGLAGGVFAVQRPGNDVVGGQRYLRHMAEDHARRVVFHPGQRGDQPAQLHGVFRHPQQQQLKLAVVHFHVAGIQLHQAAQ